MKKIFIAFVAVACALSACSDDDTADDLSRATISITPDAIPAGPDGTTTQVTVTSSGDWRLAGVCDWVHPSAEAREERRCGNLHDRSEYKRREP